MLWLAAALALAQEPRDALCSRAIGGVGGLTFGRRDYDFTTPGLFAFSESPVFSQTCARIGKSPGPSQSVFWIGLDAMPTLLHSYNLFGRRSPVWVEAGLGAGRRYGRHIFGFQVLTNSVTIGVGARWVVRLPEKAENSAPSLELKVAFYPAHDPEVRASVLVHVAASQFDPRRNPMTPRGPRRDAEPPPPPAAEPIPWPETPEWPDHWDEPPPSPTDEPPIDAPAEPPVDAPTEPPVEPPPVEPVEAPPEEPIDRPSPKVRPMLGFEVGSMMGLRAEIAWVKRGSVGLRVASLSSFRSDALLQPTALVTAAFAFGPAVSAGWTRHDNVWLPVGGGAFVFGGTGRLRVHVGVLVGREFLAPDLSTVVLW
jgi:hypothetical protein